MTSATTAIRDPGPRPEAVATEAWLQAACETAVELAGATLLLPAHVDDPLPPRLSALLPLTALAGAYIPLSAGLESITVAWVAGEVGCRALAGALLGIGADEELPSSDVADAVGEVVNMLAGGVKSRMLPQVTPIGLGLPMFLHGWIEPGERLEIAARRIQVDRFETVVLVLRQRSSTRR